MEKDFESIRSKVQKLQALAGRYGRTKGEPSPAHYEF